MHTTRTHRQRGCLTGRRLRHSVRARAHGSITRLGGGLGHLRLLRGGIIVTRGDFSVALRHFSSNSVSDRALTLRHGQLGDTCHGRLDTCVTCRLDLTSVVHGALCSFRGNRRLVVWTCGCLHVTVECEGVCLS